jgi:DNA polymerase IV
MLDHELLAKQAYFNDQALLDLSDDEQAPLDQSVQRIERALEESKRMPPPALVRHTSSFLGPTPRERQAEFEEHTKRQRAAERNSAQQLTRSSTAPESGHTTSFPVANPRSRPSSSADKSKLKRVSSLPELDGKELEPFYKRVGTIPRELKGGKNVKLANNIKLFPEHKQLLKDKIIYFYPNDDTASDRRRRIHKVIELGGAWVNRWRDDVTHIMCDDVNYTYSRLLRHLNVAGFNVGAMLV